MADSIAGTYASLGGIEIVNDSRTYSYLLAGLGPSSVNVYGDCGCPNLLELIMADCPEVTGFISPATDNAPWYSSDLPESGNFLGFITNTFEGMESTFTRSVKETVGNGGVLTRSRLGTRKLTWQGFLFGATCCSVQYGLRWLTKTLAHFDTSCRDCFGDDLQLLVCCPDTGEVTEAFRTLKGVALLEGPTILSERKTCTSGCTGGCGGSCILEVEFTLIATQPYFYSPEIPVYDCVPLTFGVTPATDSTVDCPPFDCGQPGLDDLCSVNLPPTANYTNTCIPSIVTPKAIYLTVPRSYWPALEEVVPVITIRNSGAFVGPTIKLGFYSSEDGNPCGDLLTNPPDCDALCDDLSIGVIPGRSDFYIDGRTRKMALICDNNNTAFAGERYTNGPWSWPSFSEFGFCLEIQFEDVAQAADMCVSLSLVPRTF